jgi:hypothetical protein
MSLSPVVIRDLDIVGITPSPPEADAPLLVDANAVLVCPVSTEAFQSVSRWNPEVPDCIRSINQQELAVRPSLHIWR